MIELKSITSDPISASALDFLAPNTAAHGGSQFATYSLNGNQTANRRALSGTIDGLTIGAGNTFALRWTQTDLPGTASNDGLGVDDFTLTATLGPAGVVPEPATWAMMIGGIGLAGSTLRRRQRAIVRFA